MFIKNVHVHRTPIGGEVPANVWLGKLPDGTPAWRVFVRVADPELPDRIVAVTSETALDAMNFVAGELHESGEFGPDTLVLARAVGGRTGCFSASIAGA